MCYTCHICHMSHVASVNSHKLCIPTYIKPEYYNEVFVDGKEVCISGQTADTISSCSYSAYADRLLGEYNPQDCEAGSTAPGPKRSRRIPISYVVAVSTSQMKEGNGGTSNGSACGSSVALDTQEMHHACMAVAHSVTAAEHAFCAQVVDKPVIVESRQIVAAVWLPACMALWPMNG
jgi:hypothetical protein